MAAYPRSRWKLAKLLRLDTPTWLRWRQAAASESGSLTLIVVLALQCSASKAAAKIVCSIRTTYEQRSGGWTHWCKIQHCYLERLEYSSSATACIWALHLQLRKSPIEKSRAKPKACANCLHGRVSKSSNDIISSSHVWNFEHNNAWIMLSVFLELPIYLDGSRTCIQFRVYIGSATVQFGRPRCPHR